MAVTSAGTALGDRSGAEPHGQGRSWVWQVTGLSVLLGVMLGLALRSQLQIRRLQLPGNRFSTLAAAYSDLKTGNEQLQAEVRRLRQQATHLETRLADGTHATEALNLQLQEVKFLAGLTAVHGPGLIITLRDSKKKIPPEFPPDQGLVHQEDINAILNELKAAGAEALAIGGADLSQAQRVTALTAARCAGPGTKVNDTVMGAPYRILAIGNAQELESQLRIPNGVIDNAGLEMLDMIRIERRTDITIPAYAGSIRFKYAQKAE